MVHIISKRDGPRREDVAAKGFIRENRATIDRLANHLTGGRWQEIRNPVSTPQPEPSGKLWFTPPSRPSQPAPYVRISLNGRVVVADEASGRQLLFIGAIRGSGTTRHFAMATKENGFFDPIEEEAGLALGELDGVLIPTSEIEDQLKQEISARLGLVTPGEEAG
jgi:hypothetical protein